MVLFERTKSEVPLLLLVPCTKLLELTALDEPFDAANYLELEPLLLSMSRLLALKLTAFLFVEFLSIVSE